MSSSGTTGSRHSQKDGTKEHRAQLYQSPPEAVPPLLAAERLHPVIWEPAAGRGALVRPLRAAGHRVVATDLNDWQCPDVDQVGVDLMMEPRLPDAEIRQIISNPPFGYAAQFIARCLELCPNVIMLLRLAFFEGGTGPREEHRARARILDEEWSPKRAHVFRNRLPMMHREGWTGPKAPSNTPFAWFVWEGGYRGPTSVHRISWEHMGQDADGGGEDPADDDPGPDE